MEKPVGPEFPEEGGLKVLSMRQVLEQEFPNQWGKLKSADPHPSNRSITARQDRWLKGNARLNQKGRRLHMPEVCWVEGCHEPAYVMPYLLKYYPERNETFCTGVDQDCPFLCKGHYLEDQVSLETGDGTRYTNRFGWAGQVDYRKVLPPKAHSNLVEVGAAGTRSQ